MGVRVNYLKKAQGTIEYLVIFAIVIVISLVVVSLVITTFSSPSQQISTSSNKLSAIGGSSEISINQSIVDSSGNSLIEVKNLSSDSYTLTNISSNGVDNEYSEQLVGGDSKLFSLANLQNACVCVNGQKNVSCDFSFEFITREGLTKNVTNTIEFECVDEATAVDERIVVNPINRLGSALHFNGVDEHLDIEGIDITYTDFSISGFLKKDASVVGGNYFIGQGTGGIYGNNLHVGFNSNVPYFGLYGNDVGSTVSFDDTLWHHYVFVYKTDNTKLIYRDGVLLSTSPWGPFGTTDYIGTGTLSIGSAISGGVSSSYFKGSLDEVLIFNRALSPDDVNQIYNNGSGVYANINSAPFNSGLVAGYHFDEGSGSSIEDFSGNNYDGIIRSGSGGNCYDQYSESTCDNLNGCLWYPDYYCYDESYTFIGDYNYDECINTHSGFDWYDMGYCDGSAVLTVVDGTFVEGIISFP